MVVQHSQRHRAGAARALALALLCGLAACGGGGTEPNPAGSLSAQEVASAAAKLDAVRAAPAYAALLDAYPSPAAALSTTSSRTTSARVAAARAAGTRRAALPAAGVAGAVVAMMEVAEELKGKTYVRDATRGWIVDPSAPAVAAEVVRFIIPTLGGARIGTLDVIEKAAPAAGTTAYQAVLTNLANVKVLDLAVTDARTATGFAWTVKGTITDGATTVAVDESLSITGTGATNETIDWHVKESAPALGLSIDWRLTVSDNGTIIQTDDTATDDLSVTLNGTTVREVYEYPADRMTAYVNGKAYATATTTGAGGDWTFRTADGRDVPASVADMLNRVQDLLNAAPTGSDAALSVDYLVEQLTLPPLPRTH